MLNEIQLSGIERMAQLFARRSCKLLRYGFGAALFLSLGWGNTVFQTSGACASLPDEVFDELTVTTSNPIDDASVFVRQHYLDFLNREPDASGLGFWTNEITSCNADQACIELKRINVSAAFFLSIEFQETGYLVERMYKVAFGDAMGTSTLDGAHQLPVPIIRRSEFVPDSFQETSPEGPLKWQLPAA